MQVPKLAILSKSLDHGGRDPVKVVSAIDVRSEKDVYQDCD